MAGCSEGDSNMQTIAVKRGDSFGFSNTVSDTNGPITGIANRLKCQLRDSPRGKLIEEMAITESGTPGTYIFRAGDTTTWPTIVYFDIQYTNADGIIKSTETYCLSIGEDVTHE